MADLRLRKVEMSSSGDDTSQLVTEISLTVAGMLFPAVQASWSDLTFSRCYILSALLYMM